MKTKSETEMIMGSQGRHDEALTAAFWANHRRGKHRTCPSHSSSKLYSAKTRITSIIVPTDGSAADDLVNRPAPRNQQIRPMQIVVQFQIGRNADTPVDGG